MECTECLNEMRMCRIRKYDTSCTCVGRDNTITISGKLLEITYKSYGFTADLIEAIN